MIRIPGSISSKNCLPGLHRLQVRMQGTALPCFSFKKYVRSRMHRKLDTVHTRIHTYIHAYMHRCTDTLRIPVHTHMCTHTHTHTTTHTITRTITRPHTHTYTYIHTHTPTHTYTHTYIQTDRNTDRQTYGHEDTQTYIHTRISSCTRMTKCLRWLQAHKKLYICRLHWHPTSPTQCRSNLNR